MWRPPPGKDYKAMLMAIEPDDISMRQMIQQAKFAETTSQKELLECQICNLILYKMQACIECGRIQCSHCVESWKQKRDICPNCRS